MDERPAARCRLRRWTVLAGTGVLVVAGAATLVAAVRVGGERGAGADAAAPATAPAPETVPVERRDLVATARFGGTVGFGPSTAVVASRGGLLTAVPPPGTVVGLGGVVYEVEGVAVPLFLGTRPFWRPLGPGVEPGPDIRQLEDNLVVLGAAPPGMEADDTFTEETAAAVERWQADRGVPVTGSFGPTEVVVAPGPLRLGEATVPLGAPVVPGITVATATSPVEQVTVEVRPRDLELVTIGTGVTVEPAGGTAVPGRVASVEPLPGGPDRDLPGSATWRATVEVDLPDGPVVAGTTVDVRVTERRAEAVLAVPVTALLARIDGGYTVERVEASGRREIVPVAVGLVAGGWVEVTGPLDAGERVVVAPA
jgi:hypothetical protein